MPENETLLATESLEVKRVASPVRDQVADYLRQQITDVKLRPGDRLIERELIASIGVSRTTIREALRQLEAESLVTTLPQKGTIVAMPSGKDVSQLYEVRSVLEGLMARNCCENATDNQIAEMREAFQRFETLWRGAEERGVGPEEVRVMLQAKAEFYDAIFEGADNDIIRNILRGLRTRIAAMRAITLTVPGRPAETVEETRAVLHAIERRDADAAQAASEHHVRKAAETLFLNWSEDSPLARNASAA